MLEISLFIIVALVLVLPVTVHFIERNLEPFLLLMGILAVSFSHLWGDAPVWSRHLLREMFTAPLLITLAVLVVGVALYSFRKKIAHSIAFAEKTVRPGILMFVVIAGLGIASSIITAIMAAILLVEIISISAYDRATKTKLVVYGCFSIGLGAALTPIGEPLSTIAISKLQGEPFNAGFFFLLENFGGYILPGVLAMGLLAGLTAASCPKGASLGRLTEKTRETVPDIFINAGKVYLFIMALVLLGEGFRCIVDRYIINLPGEALYWINTLSAVMDNATLAAAEISPKMELAQLRYVLVGLLLAGGMLIPGNIPNIIAAGKLNISSRAWAKIAVPLGAVLMLVYFAVLFIAR